MKNSNTSMVRLSLTDFKNHESKEFIFPKTGLYKIDGVSGSGKTNILKAIMFCLWGTGNNVIRHGAKKCRVELENLIPGVTIIREKPNKLYVNGSSDGEMQAKIVELLGMNETEFELSSYLQAEYKNSLVYKTPAEQLELFTTLAGFKNEPEILKDKIDSKITEATKELKKTEIDITVLNATQESLKNKVAEFKTWFKEEIPVDRLEGDPDDFAIEISQINLKLKTLSSELNDPDRKSYQAALTNHPYLVEKLNESLAGQAKIESEITTMPDEFELDALKATNNELNNKIAEIKSHIRKSQDREKLNVDLHTQKDLFKGSLSNYLTTEDRNILPAINSQSKELSSIYKSLDFSVENIDFSELESLLEQSEIIRKSITEKTLEQNTHRQKLGSFQSYKNLVAMHEKQLNQTTDIINKNLTLRDKEIITQEIEMLNIELNKLKDKKQALELNMAEYLAYKNICFHNQKLNSQIEKSRVEYADRKTNIATLEIQNKALQTKISDLTRFESLVNKASLDALEQVIQDVNEKAADYIDNFLGGSITAKFVTCRENKNKKKVEKIQLDITENEIAIVKISELSSGQQTKIGLAFVLAVNQIFNSPILLLDESLRGLDPQSFENCIAAIKEISNDKLVIVLEHSAFAGFFDKIVCVVSNC